MRDLSAVKTYKQLYQYVEDRSDVAVVDMARLRIIEGADRLGVNVRQTIQAALKGVGLGFVGDELPTYSEDFVRLYVRSSSIGQFIEALDDFGEDADERLRELGGDAEVKLRKIRELLR